MICKHCGKNKPVNQMFSRKLNGKTHGGIQVLDICKDCHRLASSQGSKSRLQNADGYLVALCSIMWNDKTGTNEMIYLTFCNKPSTILSNIKNILLSPVIVYGQWKTDKQTYHNILDAAKPDLFRGKWYYFTSEIKKMLMELN